MPDVAMGGRLPMSVVRRMSALAAVSGARRVAAALRVALIALLTAVLLVGFALHVHAREAAPLADDPALEVRVLAVAEELRCLVCQNETLAASHADLAVDLRRQIRLQLREGRTPEQIVDYMVARYGQFVRYRPAFDATTALLWTGPFVLLAVGAAVMAATIRRRRQTGATAELSDAETARVRQLLAPAPGDAA